MTTIGSYIPNAKNIGDELFVLNQGKSPLVHVRKEGKYLAMVTFWQITIQL
jgi:hypothetical protein